MRRTSLRAVFIRRAEGKTYCIASNSDIAPEIIDKEADFALLGSDKYDELAAETRRQLIFEPLATLSCRFGLLVPDRSIFDSTQTLSVATSYPNALKTFAAEESLKITKVRILSGKVERAPASALTDAAFDIVETGKSLTANSLKLVRESSAARLGGVWRSTLQ